MSKIDYVQLAKDKGFKDWAAALHSGTDYLEEITLYLMQRWLREEHNVQMIIVAGGGRLNHRFTVILPVAFLPDTPAAEEYRQKGIFPEQTQDTYEKALEEGIKIALKLLPI